MSLTHGVGISKYTWNWKNIQTIEVIKWIKIHLIFFPLSNGNTKTRGLHFEIVLFWAFVQFNIGKGDQPVTSGTKTGKNVKEMADSLHRYTARIRVIKDMCCSVFHLKKKWIQPGKHCILYVVIIYVSHICNYRDVFDDKKKI